VGNALETLEAVQVLHGNGPSDTVQLVCALGGVLVFSTGLADTYQEG